ncbi:hypothetical protein [Flavobacterium quisquiliarum]|uniref:Uncharacterized protein n=1 Tax=Flavobacterium quisquiliarum TaxID=1834436 RepID=A0ABV8W380_9FLAO|nr:hypothetical protein [Flavobacterium quisquiliarum]MBW1658381.1 hypothetical protein [Flavobacterium quisquiliarum]NWL02331.1 hypothetical protein [Flavobacterium collinsii]
MKFCINIYKSDLEGKEAIANFTSLKEDEDYFYIEKDEYYRFQIDLEDLVRGDIIGDLYENINQVNFDETTVFLFQKLNLNNDESLLRLIPEISLSNQILFDFSTKLIEYYQNSDEDVYFYSLEYDNLVSTLHRFTVTNENYKVDTYDTIDNRIDEVELYNYSNNTSQKLVVKNKNEINILGNKFIVKKTFFKEKKIERLSKLLKLLEVAKHYKGINCAIGMYV